MVRAATEVPGQGQHHLGEGLPLVAAVQVGGLTDLVGDAHVGLTQEEGTKGADQTGEDQGEDALSQTDLSQHLILGNDENLRGHHHLYQHQGEEQILALEVQLGKGVARPWS